MPVTIRDVAAAACVSVGTVSRALNDYPDVSSATRERVRRVARELGYTPNRTAQSLSSKHVTGISLVISGFLEDKVFNDFDTMLMRGAFQFATECGISLSLCMTNSQQQAEMTFEQLCFEHNASGAVLFGLKTDDPYCVSLRESTVPCVTVDVEVPGRLVGCVKLDDRNAAYEMTARLIELGHRRLAVVHGNKSAAVSRERMLGIEDACRDRGISISSQDVIYTNFTHDDALRRVGDYLDHREPREGVTAFVCMSDLLALGTIQAIQSRGLSVPDDFSVTGYDGISLTAYVTPQISTVDQNVQMKGYEAARLLYDMLDGSRPAQTIVLPHALCMRGSVRKISR